MSKRIVIQSVLLCVLILLAAGAALAADSLEMGRQAYDKGDYKKAAGLLKEAVAANPESFEANLYLGKALLRRNDKHAETYLLRALYIQPESAEANLELGKFYMSDKARAEARDYFDEVMYSHPGTSQASEAAKLLDEAKKPAARADQNYSISLGEQYDDNVSVIADDGALPENVSSKADWRAVLTAKGGFKSSISDKTSMSGAVSLYKSEHQDLGTYDLMSGSAGLGIQRKSSDSLTYGIRYTFDYSVLDQDPYSQAHKIRPWLIYYQAEDMFTSIAYRAAYTDYKNSRTYADNSERSAYTNRLIIDQLLPIVKDVYLVAGYEGEAAQADQESQDYMRHKGSLSLVTMLPWQITGTIGGSMSIKSFDGTTESTERVDKPWTASLSLKKKVTNSIAVSADYEYVNQHSTIDSYRYDRSVSGISLEARF